MRRAILMLLAGASLSACAGHTGPMKRFGITAISMRYMHSPRPASAVTGPGDTLVVRTTPCLLPRRDRVAVFQALRRAHSLEPLYGDVFLGGEDSPRSLLIVFRSKQGVQFTAVVPDRAGRDLIVFNGTRARIDAPDLAIVQAAAVRNGCSNSETRAS